MKSLLRIVVFLFVIAGVVVSGPGTALAQVFPNWTDYFDGFGFLLEDQRTRVYADFEWDGHNHLSVTCDDFNQFATAQEINPLGDVLTFFLWDNVTEILFVSFDGLNWVEVDLFPLGFDLQFALCSP